MIQLIEDAVTYDGNVTYSNVNITFDDIKSKIISKINTKINKNNSNITTFEENNNTFIITFNTNSKIELVCRKNNNLYEYTIKSQISNKLGFYLKGIFNDIKKDIDDILKSHIEKTQGTITDVKNFKSKLSTISGKANFNDDIISFRNKLFSKCDDWGYYDYENFNNLLEIINIPDNSEILSAFSIRHTNINTLNKILDKINISNSYILIVNDNNNKEKYIYFYNTPSDVVKKLGYNEKIKTDEKSTVRKSVKKPTEKPKSTRNKKSRENTKKSATITTKKPTSRNIAASAYSDLDTTNRIFESCKYKESINSVPCNCPECNCKTLYPLDYSYNYIPTHDFTDYITDGDIFVCDSCGSQLVAYPDTDNVVYFNDAYTDNDDYDDFGYYSDYSDNTSSENIDTYNYDNSYDYSSNYSDYTIDGDEYNNDYDDDYSLYKSEYFIDNPDEEIQEYIQNYDKEHENDEGEEYTTYTDVDYNADNYGVDYDINDLDTEEYTKVATGNINIQNDILDTTDKTSTPTTSIKSTIADDDYDTEFNNEMAELDANSSEYNFTPEELAQLNM